MLSSSTTSISTTSDPQHVAIETYWREVHSIEEEKDGEEEEEEDERKSMDEVELEEAWLTEAGLSSLVTGLPLSDEVPPPAEVLLSTLTQKQAATVRKRLDNYNETLKKRNRQPIRDVRDIFTDPDDDSPDRCTYPDSHSHHAEPPPSRYHTTTKTIRRNTPRVRPSLPTLVFEDGLPELPSSPSKTDSPQHTRSPANTCSPTHIIQMMQVDWLLRDSPYSEGVAEHKRGKTCWDCVHFHRDNNSELRGLSCAEDLSSRDLTQLGFISHIELTTFLMALGIQTKRTRPPRCRTRDSGAFGVPLNTLLERDRKKFPGVRVPIVFQKLLYILEQTGLLTEGILRVPASAARLKYLRRELDRCYDGFDWSALRQVDAASLLKLFIRELPTPLLTHTHLSIYRSVLSIPSELHQVQALQLLILLLPEANRDILRALLSLLRKVVSHQEHNRMSLWNVSMVMAPNLFLRHHHGNKRSIAKQRDEMEEAVGGAQLIRLMIIHQDVLWTVPRFLLSQVRQMNQVSIQKQLGLSWASRRLLRKKNDKNERDQITELCEGVIRVHAPLHTKISMVVQLEEQTTARDITSRFEYENSPVQHLYEVGGNICERRLHPDCVLLDVYRVNPHCDWLIKS
ncbi:rho GTPase-activating protein 28 [Archocentrus centrarchus]|uniref:rho GTPase-activating protein 28 n=1 Tax=Archocentrus centrarchus TaxID=63155 RepID=UPI0011E9D868|nr:rho GTPase-activating protein 40-like [Archocentrus centrarchus]